MTNDQTEALARMVSDAVHTAMNGATAEEIYDEVHGSLTAVGWQPPGEEEDDDWEYLLLGDGYRRSTENPERAKEWLASGGEVLRRRPLRSAGVWLNMTPEDFE